MILSLGTSGVSLIFTQYAESVYSIAFMVFLFVLLSDIFRPAAFTALKAYTDQSSQTRSTSLLRLAINLGFSVGPAVGGGLIFYLGYASLFWVDGVTCILAMLLLIYVLSPKRSKSTNQEEVEVGKSAYKDTLYIIFLVGVMLFGFAFLQYFSTMPIYYNDVYQLTEQQIGILLGFNGLLIFIIEMPLVHYLEKKGKSTMLYVFYGGILLTLSFVIIQLAHHVSLLWAAMALMSISEIVAFPFANSFALDRSKNGKTGQYMALFSIAFSISHIFGHNAGFQLVKRIDFYWTWWIIATVSVITSAILYWVYKKVE